MPTAADMQALAVIHAEFAVPVRYTGAGETNKAITAIYSDEPGMAFQGPGATIRTVAWEIIKTDLSGIPAKNDIIVEDDGAGQRWRVIDRTNRRDVGRWWLIVEETT